MFKKSFIWFFLVLILIGLAGCDQTETTTTEAALDPTIYEIGTAEQLRAMETGKNYRLTADLDLAGTEWIPIGDVSHPYIGTFDGDGHTIFHLTITAPNHGLAGLFGFIKGDILDLTVEDFSIDVHPAGLFYAGGLAAYVQGDLTDCTVGGLIRIDSTSGNVFAGLLAGQSSASINPAMVAADFIENRLSGCTASGNLTVAATGFVYAGGLVGNTHNSQLSRCSANSILEVDSSARLVYAGGLVGHNYAGILRGQEAEISRSSNIVFEYCQAYGEIRCDDGLTPEVILGGLIGFDSFGVIENSCSRVAIVFHAQAAYVGGLTGQSWSTTISNSIGFLDLEYLTLTAGQTLELAGVACHPRGTVSLENCFMGLHVGMSSWATQTETAVSAIETSDLAEASWYVTHLQWDPLLVDLSAIAVMLGNDGD